MAREEIITRKIIIEESRTIRELPSGTLIKPNRYHWLSEHIIGFALVILAGLGVISIVGVAIQHTYHIFW